MKERNKIGMMIPLDVTSLPNDKVLELENIVSDFIQKFHNVFKTESKTLPEGVPSVVYGMKGLQQVFHCGESKAQQIMDNEKYQSAFLSPRGTRNRPCNVAKLFELMSNSEN